MQPSIEVKNVSKRYRIGRGFTSLRSALSGRGANTADVHWAVRDVSFTLRPGEALGVIGPNGAGKTTILKLLSHVTKPTSGEININGRLSALIELGAGFHPDLTGRENIFLNGTILNMSRADIKQRFDQIVDFAGIGSYLDTPVKRYSSGMYARLGFAIAAHVDPEVLLVDEVLAVGDYAFQMKCYARMRELREKGTTLIFISHNMEAVRQVCDLGLVMYRGQNIFQGKAPEAVVAYSDAIRKAARSLNADVPMEGGLSQRVMTFDAEIEQVEIYDSNGLPTNQVTSGETITVSMFIQVQKDIENPIFSLTIRALDGRLIYDTTTHWRKIQTGKFSAGQHYRVDFQIHMPLLDGEFQLGVDIAAPNFSHYFDRMERALTFFVSSSDHAKGLVDLDTKVFISKVYRAERV